MPDDKSLQTPPRYNLGYLTMVCLTATMGGLLFGYDWVVIGGAKAFYESYYDLVESPVWQGFAMSSALIGCLIGAIVAGVLSDRFGRKKLLILAGALFTVSAIGTALAWDFTSFNAFRLLGGIGIGIASNMSPLYIAELSPAEVRGRFVSFNQMAIVLGVLAAQVVNWQIAEDLPTNEQLRFLADKQAVVHSPKDFKENKAKALEVTIPAALETVKSAFPNIDSSPLPEDASDDEKDARKKEDTLMMATYLDQTWSGQIGWRYMFGAEVIPAALFFLLMFFVPESPRWLVKFNRKDQAHGILAAVGGSDYADFEIADISNTLSKEEISQVRFKDLLSGGLPVIIAIGVFLAVFQQWCGINVIFNYAQDVFAAAGFGISATMLSIVLTGVVMVIATLLAIFTVDLLGRRFLMLLGAGGLAGIYAILGAGFYCEAKGFYMLVLIVGAIACYSMTLAPVTWVVISEIFPNRIRGAAMSVAVFALWAGCATLTFTFPLLNKALGTSGTFWLYGGICLVSFFVIFFTLPETKGKSLEDIERSFLGSDESDSTS